MKPKVYVASSWRNKWQPGLVHYLKSLDYPVYDFRHPDEHDHGFQRDHSTRTGNRSN